MLAPGILCFTYCTIGRDTTAQSLTWAFYLLMRNPASRRKIREELQVAFPSANKELPLSFDTIQPNCLPYTMAVFNEALRLYPPVPVELKECTSPTTFPDGISLPKGAVVMWVPWAMGRSKQIWGEDADDFSPERWFDGSGACSVEADSVNVSISNAEETKKPSLISKTAFEFPVFNGGPRSCLGKKMAELLAVYVIASLVWEYDLEEIQEVKLGCWGSGKARLSQNSLTLPMQGGLPCFVHPRLVGIKQDNVA